MEKDLVLEKCRIAKESSSELLSLTYVQRNNALMKLSKKLKDLNFLDEVLSENKKDVKLALENHFAESLINRLILTKDLLLQLSQTCIDICNQANVVGELNFLREQKNGLKIYNQQIPLGVIAIIFESRPNVIVDSMALAIKSGNGLILKGGKEAFYTNRILFSELKNSLKEIYPIDSLQFIESREDVSKILKLKNYIDVIIPRGGSSLIEFVKANALMPVIAHDKGLCHLYVHSDCTVDAKKIILNAKVQRPGVCNSLETLIIHEDYLKINEIIEALENEGVEVIKNPTDLDFCSEWLSKKLSLKIVKSHQEAILHIKKYSSKHTEAILCHEEKIFQEFLNQCDSSCLIHNASTRFNDGGELGIGAEIGISTSKFHAFGPMGAKELTSNRFVVLGNGQTRI